MISVDYYHPKTSASLSWIRTQTASVDLCFHFGIVKPNNIIKKIKYISYNFYRGWDLIFLQQEARSQERTISQLNSDRWATSHGLVSYLQASVSKGRGERTKSWETIDLQGATATRRGDRPVAAMDRSPWLRCLFPSRTSVPLPLWASSFLSSCWATG